MTDKLSKSSSPRHRARWAVGLLTAAALAGGLAVGPTSPAAEAAPAPAYLNAYIPPDIDYEAINKAELQPRLRHQSPTAHPT
ncbi:MAG: hypothetical protein LBK42_10800 [Propionibacteriaceae bacterium]|jgi:hypothetical protein|nr:hypothetical protein [Propionibacteriaceae bacterium]